MSTATATCETKIGAMPRNLLSFSLIACGALMVTAYLPLLVAHGRQLWVRPHYQFFPGVFLGAAVLAWSRAGGIQRLTPGGFFGSAGLATSAWALLAGAEVLNSSWLAAVAALIFLLSVLYTLGGGALVRRMLPAWIFLWLLVPPPFGLDNTLILSLQTLTTRWSSTLLDLVGIYHGMAGHVMEVGGQRLFVEEACAGINSLFSILACALFYVFFIRVPILRAIVLLVASVGWVLLANVMRVFLVAYLLKRWNINLAEGWRHDALGVVLFGVALGLIWSTNRLVLFLTPFLNKRADAQATAAEVPNAVVETPNWGTALNGSWLGSWLAGAAFGLLLLSHFFLHGMEAVFAAGPGQVAMGMHSLNDDSLPGELDGWKREKKMTEETRSLSNAFGQHSKTWTYHGPFQHAVVSLDYPFATWHDLTECYYGQGWLLEESTDLTSDGAVGPPYFCAHKMKKAGSRHGYLLFCQFDASGRVLSPGARGTVRATLHRQESALKRLLSWGEPSDETTKQVGAVYQCQLFVETFAPLNAQEQEKMKQRFYQVYRDLHRPFSNKS